MMRMLIPSWIVFLFVIIATARADITLQLDDGDSLSVVGVVPTTPQQLARVRTLVNAHPDVPRLLGFLQALRGGRPGLLSPDRAFAVRTDMRMRSADGTTTDSQIRVSFFDVPRAYGDTWEAVIVVVEPLETTGLVVVRMLARPLAFDTSDFNEYYVSADGGQVRETTSRGRDKCLALGYEILDSNGRTDVSTFARNRMRCGGFDLYAGLRAALDPSAAPTPAVAALVRCFSGTVGLICMSAPHYHYSEAAVSAAIAATRPVAPNVPANAIARKVHDLVHRVLQSIIKRVESFLDKLLDRFLRFLHIAHAVSPEHGGEGARPGVGVFTWAPVQRPGSCCGGKVYGIGGSGFGVKVSSMLAANSACPRSIASDSAV